MQVTKVNNTLYNVDLICKECKQTSSYNLLKSVYLPAKLKTNCKSCSALIIQEMPDDLYEVNEDNSGVIYIK